MYLSKEEVALLDESIKYFEVGFRSYIADKVICNYSSVDEYRDAINNKKGSYNGESVILSSKIAAFLDNLTKESQIRKMYTLLSETKVNCENSATVNIKTEKRDAFLLISEIIYSL